MSMLLDAAQLHSLPELRRSKGKHIAPKHRERMLKEPHLVEKRLPSLTLNAPLNSLLRSWQGFPLRWLGSQAMDQVCTEGAAQAPIPTTSARLCSQPTGLRGLAPGLMPYTCNLDPLVLEVQEPAMKTTLTLMPHLIVNTARKCAIKGICPHIEGWHWPRSLQRAHFFQSLPL